MWLLFSRSFYAQIYHRSICASMHGIIFIVHYGSRLSLFVSSNLLHLEIMDASLGWNKYELARVNMNSVMINTNFGSYNVVFYDPMTGLT